VFIIVELLYGTQGKKEKKENIVKYQYITSVKVKDKRICIQSCWKWGVGSKGVRESNGRGWKDQSKVYSQQGYI
jgi:hypothetical protein